MEQLLIHFSLVTGGACDQSPRIWIPSNLILIRQPCKQLRCRSNWCVQVQEGWCMLILVSRLMLKPDSCMVRFSAHVASLQNLSQLVEVFSGLNIRENLELCPSSFTKPSALKRVSLWTSEQKECRSHEWAIDWRDGRVFYFVERSKIFSNSFQDDKPFSRFNKARHYGVSMLNHGKIQKRFLVTEVSQTVIVKETKWNAVARPIADHAHEPMLRDSGHSRVVKFIFLSALVHTIKVGSKTASLVRHIGQRVRSVMITVRLSPYAALNQILFTNLTTAVLAIPPFSRVYNTTAWKMFVFCTASTLYAAAFIIRFLYNQRAMYLRQFLRRKFGFLIKI